MNEMSEQKTAFEELPWQPGTVPTTIEALRQFCAYNGMPLERMRFFVGEDFREPRAFGIYRDGDRYVVYKNKTDGSRAVRYQGPEEAYAVGELYAKLLDECHKRDIWPDGKPEGYERQQRRKRWGILVPVAIAMVAFAAVMFLAVRSDMREHRHDGYYRFDDDALYYRYGSAWYYDDYGYDWAPVNDWAYGGWDDYSDYYVGSEYDEGWGYGSFEDSEAWEQIQAERDSHTSSDDYSSWDSGGTDWSSDW